MTAKEYLQRIRLLDGNIDAVNRAIQREYEKAMSVSPHLNSNKVKSTKDPDVIGACVAKISDLQHDYGNLVDEYVDAKREAVSFIKNVEDERYRMVLLEYYVNKKTFEQIAVDHGKDYTTICRWHGRGLEVFRVLSGMP